MKGQHLEYAREEEIKQSLADGKVCERLRDSCVVIYSSDEDMPSKLAALEGFFSSKWLFVLRKGTEWKPAPLAPEGWSADFLFESDGENLDHLSDDERENYLIEEINKYTYKLSIKDAIMEISEPPSKRGENYYRWQRGNRVMTIIFQHEDDEVVSLKYVTPEKTIEEEIYDGAEILSFYYKLVKGQNKACGTCLWETESKTCEKCGSKTFPKNDMDWACVNCGKPGKIGLNFGKLCEKCDYTESGHW